MIRLAHKGMGGTPTLRRGGDGESSTCGVAVAAVSSAVRMRWIGLAGVIVIIVGGCTAPPAVGVREVSDYVFGGYRGEFRSPPSADGNPRHAYIVSWSRFPDRRFV